MSEPHDQDGARPDRRVFLTLAGAATLAAVARASVGHADDQLDALMGDAQRGDLGHGFDDASRTIHMPKASEPTVSAATVQTTEQAIDRYATIVARGGWPRVPAVTQLRLGDRHPSVNDLRARLVASSDIDPNAVGNDIYDSYVEAAVRRFQARHGLTVDGIIRKETLAALNVPAPVRLAQLKVNVTRLRTLSTNLGPRYVVCNLPAARIEAIDSGAAVSRHTAVVGTGRREGELHRGDDGARDRRQGRAQARRAHGRGADEPTGRRLPDPDRVLRLRGPAGRRQAEGDPEQPDRDRLLEVQVVQAGRAERVHREPQLLGRTAGPTSTS